jgi:peptide/nickel transport system substrate-binding protein
MLDRSTRPRRILALLAAALVSTAACSGGSDGGSGGGAADGSSALKIAIQSQPRSLDPKELTDGEAGVVWNGIYDTLLWLDNDLQVQPNAAESYEYSEDLRTLTLTLREGMTFSNGNPVTAEAARATLERTRKGPGHQSFRFAGVSSIEAPDERTLVIELEEPDPAMLIALTQGAGVIADPTTFDDPDLALDPVGSGGYTLADGTVDGSTYVLERREDHWNLDAHPFETVTARVIQNKTATVNALQAGELNAGGVVPDQVPRLESSGFRISDPVLTAAGALLLLDREGTITPALADVRVRKALNMAIDREGFVKSVLQGAGVATVQFANPAGDLYVEELEDAYTFDPEAARKLLAEAGYADGFSMTLPLTLYAIQIQPLMTQALKDIGITVKWVPLPPQEIASSMRSADYPAAMWFNGLSTTEAEAQDRFAEGASLNPFKVETSEISRLMEQVATEKDPDARRAIYQKIGRIAVEEAHFVPLFLNTITYATKDGIVHLPEFAPPPGIRRWGLAS